MVLQPLQIPSAVSVNTRSKTPAFGGNRPARMGDHKSQSLAGQLSYALEGGFMNTNDIILTIDAEISRLQQAKALLTDTSSPTPAKRKPGRPATTSGSGKATSFNPAHFDAKPRKRRGNECRRSCKDRSCTEGSLGQVQEGRAVKWALKLWQASAS